MQIFRKLAGNIFFKIILAFIAITFVFFGVSGFLLNGSGSWIAKIGNKTITQAAFLQEMQKNREMILQRNNNEEVIKYLDSDQFKSDILGRMVNSVIVSKLSDDLGITVSQKLILQEVAKDPNFQGEEGKFDSNKFKNFLAKNGLNEERYVKILQDEVVASTVLQSLSLVAPVNEKFAVLSAEFKQEKRVADIVKINFKTIGKVAEPSEEELKKFYEENKKNYSAPEVRKVSFIAFSAQDFTKTLTVSDEDIAAEYEKNKETLKKPETRNLMHLVFENENDAKNFIAKLSEVSDKSKLSGEFVKLAKSLQNKSQKDITLNNVEQKNLLPELSSAIFKLSLNEYSTAVKSPLGYHVLLLNKINESASVPLAEVKDQIKKKLLAEKKENMLQQKISEIDDAILASNSFDSAVQKFSLKPATVVVTNQQGLDKSGSEVKSFSALDGFLANAFAATQGQASKLFYSKINDQFYALKVEEVEVAHDKKLEEVKSRVVADLQKDMQIEKMEKLAKEVAEELKKSPQDLSKIAAKYNITVEKNKEFPRFYFLNYQGRQIPYASKFLESLFSIAVGQATEASAQGEEFMVGVLTSVKSSKADPVQVQRAKMEAENSFRNEVLQGYNMSMMKKYPVKVNEKLLAGK